MNHKVLQFQLAEKFKCSPQFVSFALRKKRDSDLAKEIRREYARCLIEMGQQLLKAA